MQFGITSATAIFEWYSSAAQYIVEKSCGISNIVHYIDDFFTLVNGLAAAKHALKNILAVFAELGLPVSLSKLEGPATTMVFLGIQFDTVTMTIRLDEERMANLLKELSLWNDRTSASREELQSLVGVLSFAKVVAPGRTFLNTSNDRSHQSTTGEHGRNITATSVRIFRQRLAVVAQVPVTMERDQSHPRHKLDTFPCYVYLHRRMRSRLRWHVWLSLVCRSVDY